MIPHIQYHILILHIQYLTTSKLHIHYHTILIPHNIQNYNILILKIKYYTILILSTILILYYITEITDCHENCKENQECIVLANRDYRCGCKEGFDEEVSDSGDVTCTGENNESSLTGI